MDALSNYMSSLTLWQALEWFGLIISFIYLWLELQQRKLMWILSAMCSMTYICIYFHNSFYADMCMSFVNICMCAYGYMQWRRRLSDGQLRKRDEKETIEYIHFSLMTLVRTALVCILLWGALYMFLMSLPSIVFTLFGITIKPSAAPVGDAFTTMINLVSIWVMARRIIEVWLMYFVCNGVCVFLYLSKGMYPTALLYSVYFFASVYGYWNWWHNGTLAKPVGAKEAK